MKLPAAPLGRDLRFDPTSYGVALVIVVQLNSSFDTNSRLSVDMKRGNRASGALHYIITGELKMQAGLPMKLPAGPPGWDWTKD